MQLVKVVNLVTGATTTAGSTPRQYLLLTIIVHSDADSASSVQDLVHREDLSAAWPLIGIDPEHGLEDFDEVGRVTPVDGRVHSFKHALVEPVHVVRTERWLERAHLVEDAAEGPDVALSIVGLIAPDLR